MTSSHLYQLSVSQARDGLKKKLFSSRELVASYLDRIGSLDQRVHAYLHINPKSLEQADRADISLPLGGIPLGVKDNFLTVGMPTTASSKVLEDYMPPYESTVTSRLINAGAIILGKTNMDAWAHGSSTETSQFGPTLNPWKLEYLPGGSSGGSAAAVAAGFCTAAIGSETAGSIRQPAAWCGVVGFKPTYGRVSRYGVISMASSTDSPGPITRTVEDAALITGIIAGKDPYDATSSESRPDDYLGALTQKTKKLRIGLPTEYLGVMKPDARKLIMKAARVLKEMGHQVEEMSLMHPKYSIGVYTIVQRSEVSSNLARYDGIRFGKDRSQFGEEAKRRVMLGTYSLSSGYYDQYYAKAQKVRTLIIEDFSKAFSRYDLIIDPPSPGPALPVGATKNEPMFGEIQDILVEPSSVAGLTGITLPCGFIDGLPVGFGLIGPQFSERLVFQVSYQFQQAAPWYEQHPSL